MNKSLFLFIITFFAITSSFGQFMSGPKGSIHAYTIHYPDKEVQNIYNPKIDIGYKLGITSIFPLSEHFSLGWDFMFSQSHS